MGKIVVSKTRGKTLVAKMALAVLCVMALSVVMHGSGLNPDAQAASNSSLMHNSANTSTKYGTWGTTKDCSWCHNSSPASRFGNNIKFVLQNISTPTGVRQATFSRITAGQSTLNAMGVLGNDERSTLTTSTNICEVCHHKTTFHQYSASKLADRTHNNRSDCTTCHAHSAGFFASCNSCHSSKGGDVIASSGLTGALPASTGTIHTKHGGFLSSSNGCDTCHNNSTASPMGNKSIEMRFMVNNTNFPQFNSFASITSARITVLKDDGVAPSLTNGYKWVARPAALITKGSTADVSCSVYCHAGWTANKENWSSATAMTCASCHTDATTAQGSSNLIGSHNQHIYTASAACVNCHPSGSYTVTHLSGNVNLNMAYGLYSSANTKKGKTVSTNTVAPTAAASYGTCSVACHGSLKPKWGTTISGTGCSKCHNAPADPTTTFKATNGTTTALTSTIHVSHINSTRSLTRTIACIECHAPARTRALPQTGVSMALHNYTTTKPLYLDYSTAYEGMSLGTRAYGPPTYSTTTQTCTNVYCHKANMNTGTAAGMAPTWNTSGYFSSTTTPTVADCQKCHDMPPNPGQVGGAHETVATRPTGFPLTTCGCHDNISNTATTFATIFVNKAKHINGNLEGGTCTSCHASVQGSRVATVGEFATQSHHVQGRAATNADCYKCHMEALDDKGNYDPNFHKMVKNSNAGINLVVWENNANGIRSTSTTYISYTANGRRSSIKKVNDHCLSCHNSKNAAFAPFVAGSTTDRYAPEQRLGLAKTSILSRYSSTRTVAWSDYLFNNSSSNSGAKYGTNQKRTVSKALSAHGNAVKNQFPQWDATANGRGDDEAMADSVAAANLSANRNVFCYDCHNSHGSNVTGITSSYSSATGRNKGGMLKTTVANQRGYTVTYTPQAKTFTYRNFSSLGQTLANVTQTTATVNPGGAFCNDCHNDDKGKTAYNYNRPWSPQATYSSSRAIVGYWSTPYFDNYTMYSAKRTTYKMGGATNAVNDRRKPMGGHFGTSVGGTNGQASHSKEINGLCTPCHDPHGVSNALGADRDHGVPLLKGTWVTSPYREDRAGVLVKRGGGSRWAGMPNMGAAPGYHIDQNTFMASPAPINGGASTVTAKANLRSQNFRSFANTSSVKTLTGYPGATWADRNFAGLCIECHNQQSLTGASTNTASAAWLSKQRIHQTVSGWSSTNGTNSANKVHAYTCSKCHAPHVSRLPRLLVTNCLDSRHFGRSVSTSIVSTGAGTNTPGNIHQSVLTSSALGAGRFPGGGAQYSGSSRATTQAQNIGGWWFQRSKTHGAAPSTTSATGTGSLCHNSTTAAGSGTYNPLLQKWNKKSVW